MKSSCKRTACHLDSVQAAWPGSALQAGGAVEMDTGGGFVLDSEEHTGLDAVGEKEDTHEEVQHEEVQQTGGVEEMEDKMEEGDSED